MFAGGFMSRKLQTLEEQYNSNPNLPNLIEYLEECKRESEWQTIIKVTEIRSGSETPEVHFYRGTALINLGKKKEGIKELKMVIAANPNHFAAKRELEKYADDEEAETSDTKANKTVRDIVIVKPALETNEHYNRLKLRNFAIAVVFIAGIIAALLRFEGKSGEKIRRNARKSACKFHFALVCRLCGDCARTQISRHPGRNGRQHQKGGSLDLRPRDFGFPHHSGL